MSSGDDVYRNLQRLARETERPTQEVMTLYILEGFLLRLSSSQFKSQLILKGGALLAALDARRPTRDIDFAGSDVSNSEDNIKEICAAIAAIPQDDGIAFNSSDLISEVIRDDDEYSGVRVTLKATLATAKITFHVDVSVGDPVVPGAETIKFPRILGILDPIDLFGYPINMVLAEKIVTAIQRGNASTRFRDFGDIYILSRLHPVDSEELRTSLQAVLAHRSVSVKRLSEVLEGYEEVAGPKYLNWRNKYERWDLPELMSDLLSQVYKFIDPILEPTDSGIAIWDPKNGQWDRQNL